MSWLTAAIYDRAMRSTEEACMAEWRAEVLAGLRGTVLEVGAGTGANLPHYPPAVTRLVLAEPDPHMAKRLAGRLDGAAGRFDVSASSAEAIDRPDGEFDAVVSTLVLCSVADPARCLAEIRRVLKPGGALVFIEHVAAEGNPGRLKWQRRVEPVWRRLMDNCHLTRRTGEAIREAGFEIERLELASMRKAWPWARPTIRGLARKPA
jgi:ubiquinone/menaquinone biosynthesis C-methylase UbiE